MKTPAKRKPKPVRAWALIGTKGRLDTGIVTSLKGYQQLRAKSFKAFSNRTMRLVRVTISIARSK